MCPPGLGDCTGSTAPVSCVIGHRAALSSWQGGFEFVDQRALGTGLAIGIAIGVAIGLFMDNVAVGIAIGVALGIAIAYQRR
jgi:hypothetical protein